MCNIAGYVGTRPAAPILIEMLRKQEGLNGGFYAGLATVCDGKIHYRKVVGSVDHLVKTTDVLSLPGTIGIIHTRTPGGGDVEWGHPFLGEENGEVRSAYVLNGYFGHFKSLGEDRAKIARELIAQGYTFRSRAPGLPAKGMPELGDGTSVHGSDVMCNLVLRQLQCGKEPADALQAAFMEMPEEIVGLLLTRDEDHRIPYCRFDMPMNVGFAPHGAYLASAALCFPDDAREHLPLPAGTVGYVYRDRYTAIPFDQLAGSIAPIHAHTRKQAYDIILGMLEEGLKTFVELSKAIVPVFEPADCIQRNMLAYETLDSLSRENRISITAEEIPGMEEGLTAPRFRIALR